MKNSRSNHNIDLIGQVNSANWYRKWWIWITLGIIMIIAIGTLYGVTSNSKSSSSSSSSYSASPSRKVTKIAESKALHKTFHVGQTVNYKGLGLTVDHIYYWSGDDINTPDNGKQYVMAKVTAKNNTNSSKDADESNFQLDDNGSNDDWDEFLDNDAPHGGKDFGSSSLDPHKSKTGFLYGQGKIGDKLALIYHPDDLNNNKRIRVDLN